jgi:hypothetical protein
MGSGCPPPGFGYHGGAGGSRAALGGWAEEVISLSDGPAEFGPQLDVGALVRGAGG